MYLFLAQPHVRRPLDIFTYVWTKGANDRKFIYIIAMHLLNEKHTFYLEPAEMS